jgi:hypothetical protein
MQTVPCPAFDLPEVLYLISSSPLVSLLSAVKLVFVRHLHSLTIGLQLCLVRLRVRQV